LAAEKVSSCGSGEDCLFRPAIPNKLPKSYFPHIIMWGCMKIINIIFIRRSENFKRFSFWEYGLAPIACTAKT